MSATQGRNIQVYGYELFGEVHYYINEMVLLNYRLPNPVRIKLRSTMANMLNYLLLNSERTFISDDEVMLEVWERNNLRASYHRLWQVTRDLNYKIMEAGIVGKLFTRVPRRRGFCINKDAIVFLCKQSFEQADIA